MTRPTHMPKMKKPTQMNRWVALDPAYPPLAGDPLMAAPLLITTTVERDLQTMGVCTVVIPRQAKTSPARKTLEAAAASAGWSNGAPAQRDGSVISNAAT